MPVGAYLQCVLQDNIEIPSYSWTNLLLPWVLNSTVSLHQDIPCREFSETQHLFYKQAVLWPYLSFPVLLLFSFLKLIYHGYARLLCKAFLPTVWFKPQSSNVPAFQSPSAGILLPVWRENGFIMFDVQKKIAYSVFALQINLICSV